MPALDAPSRMRTVGLDGAAVRRDADARRRVDRPSASASSGFSSSSCRGREEASDGRVLGHPRGPQVAARSRAAASRPRRSRPLRAARRRARSASSPSDRLRRPRPTLRAPASARRWPPISSSVMPAVERRPLGDLGEDRAGAHVVRQRRGPSRRAELDQHAATPPAPRRVPDRRAQPLQAAVRMGDRALLLGVGLGREDDVGVALDRLGAGTARARRRTPRPSASSQAARPGWSRSGSDCEQVEGLHARRPRGGVARLGGAAGRARPRRPGRGRGWAGSRPRAGRGRWPARESRAGPSPRRRRGRAAARGRAARAARRRRARRGRGARPRSPRRSPRPSAAPRRRAGPAPRPRPARRAVPAGARRGSSRARTVPRARRRRVGAPLRRSADRSRAAGSIRRRRGVFEVEQRLLERAQQRLRRARAQTQPLHGAAVERGRARCRRPPAGRRRGARPCAAAGRGSAPRCIGSVSSTSTTDARVDVRHRGRQARVGQHARACSGSSAPPARRVECWTSPAPRARSRCSR